MEPRAATLATFSMLDRFSGLVGSIVRCALYTFNLRNVELQDLDCVKLMKQTYISDPVSFVTLNGKDDQ